MTNRYLPNGKISFLIDGQFGSTGKGLYASYIGSVDHIDIAVTNGSPNAGHTGDFCDGRGKIITRHLPMSVMSHKNNRSTIYLCAGAIIDVDILLKEIEDFDVDPYRICIHPSAAIIKHEDIESEATGSVVSKIASTQKGVGSALASKILRRTTLAKDDPKLYPFIKRLNLSEMMDNGCVVFMEIPQGVSLGINQEFYPYCTSRDISISGAMSDAQIHPTYIGKTFMSVRTYPIRVGNLIDINGENIGTSGEFYPDSIETTWEELELPSEMTTVTKRIRRVATFSEQQYKNSIELCRPDYVLLNFVNQCADEGEVDTLVRCMSKYKSPTHIGLGATVNDVFDA